MSSKIDVVRTWITTVWSNPPSSVIEGNKKYLSDNFRSVDKDGTVRLDKEAYIGMAKLLLSGFTNIKWVRSGIRQEGDRVIMTGHFEGEHTGDLDLTSLGAGIIPASGKMIVWPEASLAYNVEGDKIVKETPLGEGNGVDALLEPLGVKLPST